MAPEEVGVNPTGNRNGPFHGLTRDAVLLSFVSFFADTATEMLYPVLPIFLTQVLLAPVSAVGIIEGIADGTRNIVQGFSGWFADRVQRRKPVALVGYGVAAAAKPFIGLAVNWPQVLAARFLDRLATGVRSAPRDALIAGSVQEAYRGKAFGVEGIGDNLGAFVGPLIAAALIFAFHLDLRLIFFLAFIPGALAFLTVALVKESPLPAPGGGAPSLRPSQFPAAYWRYLLVAGLFGLGSISSAFLILETKAIGASTETAILIYAFFNLVAAMVSYPIGMISDRVGRKLPLLASFVIAAVTYLGFALSSSLLVIGALFVLYGAYSGIFRATGRALATDFVPQAIRASGVGWYSSTVGITSLVANIVGGQLWSLIGPAYTFGYALFFSIVGTLALSLLRIPRRQP